MEDIYKVGKMVGFRTGANTGSADQGLWLQWSTHHPERNQSTIKHDIEFNVRRIW